MILHRKPNRLKNYDYSSQGAYFITVCTIDRKCILSQIVGGGVLDAPEIQLSEYGKVIENQISIMNSIYNNVNVENLVIMPNHIHMLLVVNGSSWTPTPTNAAVPGFVSAFKRFCNKKAGHNIWQRSYYDHIIRDEEDYINHLQYIEDNPAKWLEDKYYIM